MQPLRANFSARIGDVVETLTEINLGFDHKENKQEPDTAVRRPLSQVIKTVWEMVDSSSDCWVSHFEQILSAT